MTTGRPNAHPADDDTDRGSATVLGAGIVAVVIVLLVVVAGAGHVAAMNLRAAKAADLAALAAADAARGLAPGEPCAVAASVTEANDARLARCAPAPDQGDVIDVEVEVTLLPVLDVLGPARGIARAGPPPSETGASS